MPTCHIFNFWGQSNELGNTVGAAPAGIPTSAINFLDCSPGNYTDDFFKPLDRRATGHFGPELTFGLRMLTYLPGGDVMVINKCSKGTTTSTLWLPGDASGLYAALITQLDKAIAQCNTLFPGYRQRFYSHHTLGETEAGGGTPPTAYAANIRTIIEGIRSHVGQAAIYPIATQINAAQTANTSLTVLRQQVVLSAYRVVSLDDIPVGADYDGLHYSATVGGQQLHGTRVAVAMRDALNPTMGTLAIPARNALVDHQNNKAAYTSAGTHYVHWYAGGVALTSGNSPGYVRNSFTNDATAWPDVVARVKANGAAWVQTPSGTGLSPDEVRVTDNSTEGAGTLLASDTFTPVAWSVAQGPISVAAGAFTITAPTHVATGGFVDSVVSGLLNLMFGAKAYSQLTNTFLSYWVGDPAGAGAQAGSRVSLTQASQWAAAANGQAQSVLPVSLTQQVTGTYLALHDASTAGNLLLTAPRSASIGASGTILAGQLLTTMV